MEQKLEKPPLWAARAMQGITYWVGHHRCLFSSYPLTEGALVAEICSLIYANLPRSHQLSCEIQYSKIAENVSLSPELRDRKCRADLVISEKSKHGDPIPKFIIEVKRASAPRRRINDDLLRLAKMREKCPGVRAFLFLISEADRPRHFVTDTGQSIPGRHSLEIAKYYFRVRRTWKAAHAYKWRDKAQYACLLEVFVYKKSS